MNISRLLLNALSIVSLIFVFTVAFSRVSFAHTDENLDTLKAPHGGQLRMAGPYHYELVMKRNEVSVYVTDHAGTSINTQDATGTAIVLSGKKRTTVKLHPKDENGMRGRGHINLTPDMKISVSITLAGQKPEMTHFTPMHKPKVQQQATLPR